MTLVSLLYVSVSTLSEERADAVVRNLVAAAKSANLEIGVTGALVFTGGLFAQILEGEDVRIDRLFAAIARDPRHKELKIIARTEISHRRFPGWSLAYMGPSQFVSRHVTQLLGHTNLEQQRRAGVWVADLMAEFAIDT